MRYCCRTCKLKANNRTRALSPTFKAWREKRKAAGVEREVRQRSYYKDVERSRRRAREYQAKNPQYVLFNNRRWRAAHQEGREFTIRFNEIVWPTHCPVLGIALDYGRKGKPRPNSPSLDRTDPSKGYVSGNVVVISYKANVIKQNCTDPEVFRRIADYVERVGFFA